MKRAVQTFILTAAIWGSIWDKLGTRYYRLLLNLIYLTSTILLSQASKDNTIYLIIAYPLLHISGMATYTTNLRLPSIFPHKAGFIIQAINGALDASACTFLLAKSSFFEKLGLPAEKFYQVWTFLAAPTFLIRTLFFMPKHQIVNKIDQNEKISIEVSRIESVLDELESEKRKLTDNQINHSKSLDYQRSFTQCIFTKNYFFHILWFFIVDSWMIVFMMNFFTWATRLTDDHKYQTSFWVNIWALFQFAGAPLAMLVGHIYDSQKSKIINKTGCSKIAQLQSLALVFFITTTAGILSAVTSSFKIQNLQWLTFTFLLAFRSCVYGNNAQALQILYPNQLFGKLYGFKGLFSRKY